MTDTASALYSINPLVTPTQQCQRVVAPGTRIQDLAPPPTVGPFVCRYNGEYLLRKDWWIPVSAGDTVEFHVLVQGGGKSGVLRIVLQIALAVALQQPQFLLDGGFLTAGEQLFFAVVGNALINAIVPLPKMGGAEGEAQSQSYNVQLSANSARKDQPLPVVYGRMKVTPDYACQPYTEYVDNDEDDQFFHALYCIGEGRFWFNGAEGPEALLLDDTPLDHFQDVQYNWLPPGTAPSLVLPNVVTAVEVSGQELKTGKFVGGFTACGPGLTATAIGVDLMFQGLGIADSGGDMDPKTVDVRFDYRPVDDFGTPLAGWSTLSSISVTDSTSKMVRRSYKITLPTPVRAEVRAVRTSAFSDNNRHLNTATWGGMRAYLSQTSPLSSTATHLEVKVRSSEQLNGLSQRKITTIVRRMLPTWDPNTGWGPEVETRSIAWALADIWKNPVYGEGLDDERIDLQTLYDLDQVWAARQDYCDGVFDGFTDAWSAAASVASAGRAAPFRRNGVRSVARDQLQTLPVTAFTSRNILEGTLNTSYLVPTRETADAVIVEYFDYRIWDWTPIVCPCPGVTTPTNPLRVRLPFITRPTQAEREGLYRAAVNFYRRKISTWQTDMLALLPYFGASVVLSPRRRGWGQAGDVVDWNGTTKVMTLSEPPDWTVGGTHYITLVRSDGSVHDPINVTPGLGAKEVVLASDPDFTLTLDDAGRERTKYVFGSDGEHRRIVRMLGISPEGRMGEDEGQPGTPIFKCTAISEDERVHTRDNHLLPAGGEEQDPVNPGSGGGGGGGGSPDGIVSISSLVSSSTGTSFGDYSAGYQLRNTGVARTHDRGTYTTLTDQWFLGAPVEPSVAAKYEVKAVLTPNPDLPPGALSGTLNAWLDCASDNEWDLSYSLAPGASLSAELSIEIRDKVSLIVADSATITLLLSVDPGV